MKQGILSYGANRYVLNSPVCVIGRSQSCDLVIDDPSISRRHCVIVKSNLRFVVFDFKSSNGVSFKEEPVFQKELSHGDLFKIGDREIKFSLVEHFSFGSDVHVDNYEGLLLCEDYNDYFNKSITTLPAKNVENYEIVFEQNKIGKSENESSRLIVSTLDHVAEGLGAARGFIATFNPLNHEIDIKAALNLDSSKISTSQFYLMLFKQTYLNRNIVATTDVLYEYLYQDPELIFLDIGSVICAPIFRSGTPFGLIYLARTMTTAAFSDDEKKVLCFYSYCFSLNLDRLLLEEELRNNLGQVQIVEKAKGALENAEKTHEGTKPSIKCEICGEGIDEHPPSNLVICLSCHTIHHKDCWIYYGSCPIYGCSSEKYKGLDEV